MLTGLLIALVLFAIVGVGGTFKFTRGDLPNGNLYTIWRLSTTQTIPSLDTIQAGLDTIAPGCFEVTGAPQETLPGDGDFPPNGKAGAAYLLYYVRCLKDCSVPLQPGTIVKLTNN